MRTNKFSIHFGEHRLIFNGPENPNPREAKTAEVPDTDGEEMSQDEIDLVKAKRDWEAQKRAATEAADREKSDIPQIEETSQEIEAAPQPELTSSTKHQISGEVAPKSSDDAKTEKPKEESEISDQMAKALTAFLKKLDEFFDKIISSFNKMMGGETVDESKDLEKQLEQLNKKITDKESELAALPEDATEEAKAAIRAVIDEFKKQRDEINKKIEEKKKKEKTDEKKEENGDAEIVSSEEAQNVKNKLEEAILKKNTQLAENKLEVQIVDSGSRVEIHFINAKQIVKNLVGELVSLEIDTSITQKDRDDNQNEDIATFMLTKKNMQKLETYLK